MRNVSTSMGTPCPPTGRTDLVEEVAASRVLEDHVVQLAVAEAVQQADDVGVLEVAQDLDLLIERRQRRGRDREHLHGPACGVAAHVRLG